MKVANLKIIHKDGTPGILLRPSNQPGYYLVRFSDGVETNQSAKNIFYQNKSIEQIELEGSPDEKVEIPKAKKPSQRNLVEIAVTEEKNVLNSINAGMGPIFLITGEAGTGKSTLVEALKRSLIGNTVVVAFTGVAALNVGGETIHSFFGFPVTILTEGKTGDSNYSDKFKAIDYLIIDEVSMLRADILDAIFTTFEKYGKNPALPLGGVKFILVGDFLQLDPVLESDEHAKRYFYSRYSTTFFFEAKGLENYKTHIFILNTVHRQKQDSEFLDLLSRVRRGMPTQDDCVRLSSRVGKKNADSLFLTTTNERVDEINSLELNKLSGKLRSFDASIAGNFHKQNYPVRERLDFKVGAKVMFLRNDTQKSRRWVNGTMGTLVDFGKDSLEIRIHGSEIIVSVQKALWESFEYRYDKEKKTLDYSIVGTFEQFPIGLAWASTIHKSQGKTIPTIHIDLPENLPAMPSQFYVALSRVKQLTDITLSRGPLIRDFIVNKRASQAWQLASDNVNTAISFHLPSLIASPISELVDDSIKENISIDIAQLINEAVKSGARISMDYVSGSGRKWRVVRPVEWEIINTKFSAYCEENKENRSFRVDRIQDAKKI